MLSPKTPLLEIKHTSEDKTRQRKFTDAGTTVTLHCEPKKHTRMFSSYLPQNPVDSAKIWYTLS